MHDVAVIGNYTKDTIVTQAGTRHVDGGGFNYAAHALRLMQLQVAIVTRLAQEDWHVVRRLEEIGCTSFAVASPHSTLMRLEYPTANVDERILTVARMAEPFAPAHVAAVDARAWIISPSIRGEVPAAVVTALKQKAAIVALDVQGFVRIRAEDGRLSHAPWPEQEAVLGNVTIVKSDAVEAESLTGTGDIEKAARHLSGGDRREIVLTHKDGLLVRAGGENHHFEFRPRPQVGRSGRGDTCAASYVGRRLNGTPREAGLWAAAVTSMKLEAEGPVRGTLADAERFLAERYGDQVMR
jgi:sugar/nucleoside kinase (ribokinase family)